MDLNEIVKEIREIISQKQKELELTFIEDKHIYYMKDIDGKIKNNFMSVSKLIKKFYKPFDSEGKALQMSNGDPIEAKKLMEQWKVVGDNSTNMGSRVHFLLESDVVKQYGDYKEVRQPIFTCDQTQIEKSDNMVNAGRRFINLMHERGAVLLDTEMVLGDPELRYTGQPDKFWIMMNKDKTNFGIVTTDWKTNQEKNFQVQWYNGYLYSPFNDLRDYSLTHYYLQLPLYARLLLKMLKGSKYEDMKLLGCVIVHLKDDGTFTEYKVPQEVNKKIFSIDITKYTK
jgi:hypothetical protein